MRCKHSYKAEWYNDYLKYWNCYKCEKCGDIKWIKEEILKGF